MPKADLKLSLKNPIPVCGFFGTFFICRKIIYTQSLFLLGLFKADLARPSQTTQIDPIWADLERWLGHVEISAKFLHPRLSKSRTRLFQIRDFFVLMKHRIHIERFIFSVDGDTHGEI